MKRIVLVLILLALTAMAFSAETVRLGLGSNTVTVLSATDSETIVQYTIAEFEKNLVKIDGQAFYQVRLPQEGFTQDKGMPELPVFNRSIIIDNNALMKMEVYDLSFQDIKLQVVPSKGVITRNINPQTVPFTFDNIYMGKDFYPRTVAELSEPYILRDFRGITIKTTPFAYNPSTQTLRVYTGYKIRVYADGLDTVNTLNVTRDAISRDFAPIYENHFINWESFRYTPVSDAYGKMLVICHTNYLTQIAPFVNWKKQKGINTELVEWSTIGTTATQLQTYIQNRYNADNTINYVQIVGDAPQIPSLSSGGGGSDPTFALVAGSDNYPDIFVGRFSAENTTDVTTQVNKAITYERDLNTSDTWLANATGIASNEGGGTQGDNGESDATHMNNIRTDLLGYGYTTVDQIYQGTGGNAAQISAAVNAGRGFINYVGHGSDTSWASVVYTNTDVNALTNGTKTPFIMDVACVNGNFVSLTCFAEAWLRKANGGAVAIYASSINQSWNSPMLAEDECTDLLVAQSKTTTGGLYYNSSCKMMDTYGNTTGSDGVNMYKTWHIFGDASLMVRTKTPQAMTVTYPATILVGATSVTVNTGVAGARVAITYNNTIYGVANANSSGVATVTLTSPPTGALTYTVTVTAYNKVTYVGTLQQIVGSGPYMSVLSTTYADSNNSVAEYNESGRYNVTFKNIGTTTATNVTATLTCSTAGITLTDATETIASLAANASSTINNAFSFNVANNIVNQLSAAFTVTMVSGTETWTYNFNQVFNAPALAFGSMTISDPSPGNNNGRLDPGETVTITMPLINSGAATSPTGTASLSSPTSGITVNTGSVNFAALAASGSTNLSFSITAASGMPIGTVATFNFNATAGAYTASKAETSTVGIILEDFETGNFSAYPWIQGTTPWTVVNTGAYAGTYAAKSGLITASGSTTMQTTRILTTGGTLSFYYKVSSEATYDFLKFYIDGTLQNSWSGEVAWTQATYALAAGTRTLKWEYTKDTSVDNGSDCAWIDNIVFPASTAPSSFYPPQNLIAGAGNGVVNLSWQAPLTGTPTGYKIYKNSTLLTTITALSYNDTAVTNGTSYSYFVKAAYSGGDSDASNTVTATPEVITSVTIGTGTTATGTSEASPINIYYESLHGQSIYTAAELNAAGMIGAQNITQLGFYVVTVPSLALPNFVIRMMATTDTNVANWQTATDMQTVYTNSSYLPVAGDYHMLTLSTPFQWNGTSNIVIDTAFGVLSSWTSSGTVRYTSTTNGYRYVRLDDVNQTNVFTGGSATVYRPNLKLTFQPVQTNAPIIATNPSSVSQTVNTGASTTTNLTISNTGTASLTWNSADREMELRNANQLSGAQDSQRTTWLSISPSSGTIAAGENTVVTLTMNSAGLANNTYTKNLTITSNATNNPSLVVPISFTVSDLLPNQPRFVAEWEPADGAIIRYPLGIPYTLVRDLAADNPLYVIVTSTSQATANTAFSSNGVNMANVHWINAATDSYWLRDYGPWTIMDANNNMKIVDVVYNRPRPNDDVIPTTIAGYLGTTAYNMAINHTGGNIMTDGQGKAMSTELVWNENPSLTHTDIDNMFQTYLGINEYQIYDDPNNTYIDHIDCWGKLIDVDKVVIRSVPSTHAQYSAIQSSVAQWQAKTSSYGTPYRIYRVYTPNDEPYTNAYILNKKIFVPQMGTANDAAALQVYRDAMPGYTVTGYSDASFLSTDAIHCRINTIFDAQMVSIKHVPPVSATAYGNITLQANIAHTNTLNAFNTYVAYKTGTNGSWQYSSLSNLSANQWTVSLTAPALGDTIFYWFKATDDTGRYTTLPLCMGSDPFKLVVNIPSANNPPVIDVPDSFSFNQDGSLVIDLSPWVSDPENDELNLNVYGYTNLDVNINGMVVTITAPGGWIGSEELNFTVCDAELCASDLANVTVTLASLSTPQVAISALGYETTITWTSVPHAASYKIYASDEPYGTFDLLGQTEGLQWVVDSSAIKRFYHVVASSEPIPPAKQ